MLAGLLSSRALSERPHGGRHFLGIFDKEEVRE